VIKGFKGFDKDLKCSPNGNSFQYEIGKEYEVEEKPIMCTNTGFHFCENPLDVFAYYPPAGSRYCEVEGDGEIDKGDGDSKVAVSKIKIGLEVGIKELIDAGVKFILEKVDWKNSKESNTGYRSAATNTGYRSAATNTGDQSAATNTGDQSAATNTGYRSAATNTGDRSAASVEGKESVACALGIESKAKGTLGCWIVIAEWEWLVEKMEWHIKEVKSALVDGETVKTDTWYTLKDGEFVIVE